MDKNADRNNGISLKWTLHFSKAGVVTLVSSCFAGVILALWIAHLPYGGGFSHVTRRQAGPDVVDSSWDFIAGPSSLRLMRSTYAYPDATVVEITRPKPAEVERYVVDRCFYVNDANPIILDGMLDWRFYAAGWYQFSHGDCHMDVVEVPYVILFILFAAPPAIYLRQRRTCRRTVAGLCIKCGYDLRATLSRCPECGTEAKKVILRTSVNR